MKKRYTSILLFGFLLAILALLLQFFEYRYYIGRLDVDVYTALIATMFTLVGIWVGINLLKQTGKQTTSEPGIDQSKIDALKLNEREYEILQLIAKGHTNQEIADQLFLALPTIKTHTSNLYSKLDVRSRTQAIHKAQSLNLI